MDIPVTRSRRPLAKVIVALLVAGAAVAVTAAMGAVRSAAPVVSRSSLWIDRVRRGTMVREVSGFGTLVPRSVHWLSAPSSGRVGEIFVQSGAPVQTDTVLLRLENPEIALAALEAERQLSTAESSLATLVATTRGQKLQQEAAIAGLATESEDADRRARADAALLQRGFLSEIEVAETRGRQNLMKTRLGFERKRSEALRRSVAAQVAAQKNEVTRLRAIAAARNEQVRALTVTAKVAGVVQQLPLEVGQSVAAGALLAKVAEPGRLKAVVRVPELLAKDVAIGQSAAVDTRAGVVKARVIRIDAAVQAGAVLVDLGFDEALPKAARPDLSIEVTIEIDRLPNVLYISRPAVGQSDAAVTLFRLGEDDVAHRTPVVLGRVSTRFAEIVNGLAEKDEVIVSDTSRWADMNSLRIR